MTNEEIEGQAEIYTKDKLYIVKSNIPNCWENDIEDFSNITCDNIKFTPLEFQSIEELEKEYEKLSKYFLDKINKKYANSIMSDRICLQIQQEFMDVKRRYLDPISERITQLANKSLGYCFEIKGVIENEMGNSSIV